MNLLKNKELVINFISKIDMSTVNNILIFKENKDYEDKIKTNTQGEI